MSLMSPVQQEHFFALILMVEKHSGHSFVVGAAGFSSFLKWNLLIPFTMRNRERATSRKLMIA